MKMVFLWCQWILVLVAAIVIVDCYGSTSIVRTESPPESQWKQVAMDSSGQVQYALSVQYSLFLSLDYGGSWSLANSALIRGGLSVACDSSGQLLLVGTAVGLFLSDDYGRNVAIVDGTPYGSYIAVGYSGNGQYLAGVMFGSGLYMSRDFGQSWSLSLPAPHQSYWRSLAINGNGQNVFVVPSVGDIYRSTDGGLTWSNNTVSSKDWTNINVDVSGNIVVASSVYGLVRSTDAGVSWDPLNNVNTVVEVMSQSADGTCIVATGSSEPVMVSKDSGQTWTAFNVPSTKWSGVVVSSNCEYILLSVENGGLFLSSNQGVDWVVHISTCEATTGYSNGECRTCNVITSPEGHYVNDGSELFCTACPEFTVSFDSESCTNPCVFPYVPSDDYFTQSSSKQCTLINYNTSIFAIGAIIVFVAALYLFNLVILFIHIPKLGQNHVLAMLVVVFTALPCLEFMATLLYLFMSTLYNTYIMGAIVFSFGLPCLFILKDFWYKRLERHMQVRIIGESLVTKKGWEWIQYHRLVTDQFAAFLLANVVFGVIAVLNLVWILPMLCLLFVLYATKLYAFGSFAKKWHGWWSGYYETSIPMVMTWTHGRASDYIIDIHFFHERTLYDALMVSMPQFALQLYNGWQLREISPVLLFTLTVYGVSLVNILYRLVYYQGTKNVSLKEMTHLLNGLNDAAEDELDDGSSPIRRSTTGAAGGARDPLRYSALQTTDPERLDLDRHGKLKPPSTTAGGNAEYTSVYQRRQFRHRQMALRRDHVRAKMKDTDVAWERRMRQARWTIQRRLAQIQAIVNQPQPETASSTSHNSSSSSALQQLQTLSSLALSPTDLLFAKSTSVTSPMRSTGDSDTLLLQPRESFALLQRARDQDQTQDTSISPVDTNSGMLPTMVVEDAEDLDELVRELGRTLKSLDADLAQFLSEEIETKLVAMAIDIRRKSSMIPATASERGSFS